MGLSTSVLQSHRSIASVSYENHIFSPPRSKLFSNTFLALLRPKAQIEVEMEHIFKKAHERFHHVFNKVIRAVTQDVISFSMLAEEDGSEWIEPIMEATQAYAQLQSAGSGVNRAWDRVQRQAIAKVDLKRAVENFHVIVHNLSESAIIMQKAVNDIDAMSDSSSTNVLKAYRVAQVAAIQVIHYRIALLEEHRHSPMSRRPL